MRQLVLVLFGTLALATCHDSKPRAGQSPQPGNGFLPAAPLISAAASPWSAFGRRGAPVPVTGAGGAWVIDVPACPGVVGYVHRAADRIPSSITMAFSLSGSGSLAAVDPNETAPTHVALFFERAGNVRDGSANDGRWWSNAQVDLAGSGSYTLSASLTHDAWTTVYGPGSSEAFQSALGSIGPIGFTFGGKFFKGHGVCAQGDVRFVLTDYRVD